MIFHENLSSGGRCDTCGRTDGHNKGSSRFSQLFCEGTKTERILLNLRHTEDRGSRFLR